MRKDNRDSQIIRHASRRTERDGAGKHLTSHDRQQASPRDVFYQALLLQNKVQILRFEQTGVVGLRMASVPERPITSEDSIRVLKNALGQIRQVAAELGVQSPTSSEEKNPALSANRAFQAVVLASQQIDPLLKSHPIVPADVFQVVSRTVHMLSAMSQKLDGYTPPVAPEPVASMRAGAVFNGLRRAYVFLRRIRVLSGFPTMALGELEKGTADTPSARALMLAQVLYAHVDHMYRESSVRELGPAVYFPGPTTSANVYTLVHQLELLSWEMSEQVKVDPTWFDATPVEPPSAANTNTNMMSLRYSNFRPSVGVIMYGEVIRSIETVSIDSHFFYIATIYIYI